MGRLWLKQVTENLLPPGEQPARKPCGGVQTAQTNCIYSGRLIISKDKANNSGNSNFTRRQLIGGAAQLGLLTTGGMLGANAVAASSSKPQAAGGLPAQGEYLIKGGYVMSMDAAIGDLELGDIHVKNGAIVAVAPGISARGAEVIDAAGMIVMPGFIDTHWHMWHAIFRNFLREGLSYFPVKYALSEYFKPEDVHNGNRLALADAINAGFTTVHNFAHNVRSPEYVDAELSAWAEFGMRGRYSVGWKDGHPFTEIDPSDDLTRIQKQWMGPDSPTHGMMDLGRAVRGPMYTKHDVYAPEIEAAYALDLPVTMHAGITRARTISAAQLHKEGFLNNKTMLVHFLLANRADREAMVEAGVSLSATIKSELRGSKDGGFRRNLLHMLNDGVNVCLSGVDANVTSASSMFDAMSTAWAVGIPKSYDDTVDLKAVEYSTCLAMTTVNGAKALGLSDVTGTLTPGKRADVILIRATDINMVPMHDVRSAVVKSARVANVDTVLLDGRIRKRGGQLIGIDVPEIAANAARSLHNLQTRAGGDWAPKSTRVPTF
jgi:cytosine/adenosine deaminase-related metal-dependent hydrolase